MHKKIIALATIIGLSISNNTWAQFKVDAQTSNVKSQPVWGPIGYDYVSAYYLPEHNIYYVVAEDVYCIKKGSKWEKHAALPKKYGTIDLFKTYKYVVQDGSTEPYLRHKNIRKDAMSYNNTLQQIPILDAVQFDDRYK